MKRALVLAAAVFLAANFVLSTPPLSQDQKAEGKYAALCGDYSFDLSAFGIGTISIRVYAENDNLYIWASTSDSPDPLIPVERQPAKFTIDDPDEGHWDFEFLKDDAGKTVKLRIVNEGMGIDAVGQRIGG
jgi:hypothetical protein